jgi:FkbM family methyltransferase
MLEEHLLLLSNNKYVFPKDHINYLYRLKAEGFEPKVIYDIGSNVLHWAKHAREIWPDAKIILFDAFKPAEFLYKDYDYHIGLLSDKDGNKVKFYQNDQWPGGNSYYRENNNEYFPQHNYVELKTKTLDTVVKERGFPLPDFIKIDTQGSEIDILRGATNTIKYAKKMIVELQRVEFNLGAKLVDESLKIIETMGWKCIDPLFCDNGPDGDYGFIPFNVELEKNRKIIIGLEGIGFYGTTVINYLLKKAYPKYEIEYKNDKNCDFIIDSHYDANNPDWNLDNTKKYISWSGESFPPYERKQNQRNKLYVLSTINQFINYIHIPFCLFSPFLNKPRKYKHNNRKHLLAYCSSHTIKEREEIYNLFVEKTSGIECHAYGNCFGKYIHTKKEKAQGIWDSEELIDIYKDYKFVIAMENTRVNGYVTEKIVNAFYSGAIPIYWGSQNINDYFNRKAFINVSDFRSFEDCVEYVIHMNEDTRKKMLAEPIYNESNELIHLLDEDYNSKQKNKTLTAYIDKLKQFLNIEPQISSDFINDNVYSNSVFQMHNNVKLQDNIEKTSAFEMHKTINVGLFSGFKFHYEMFGYIIYYCKVKNYKLTIYCDIENDKHGNVYLYKKMFNKYPVEYKQIGSIFDIEKHKYDILFLTTDDDALFKNDDIKINKKTICIDHDPIIRSPMFKHHVAVRPFPKKFYRDWALPIYPIITSQKKIECLKNSFNINIVLIGNNNDINIRTQVINLNYKTDIINRIKTNGNKKIIFHVISRFISKDDFKGLHESIIVEVHKSIPSMELLSFLYKANYILSDVTQNADRVSLSMSGSIPLSLSSLSPLIIEKETNSYYQFKNVIEFDKNSTDDIVLEDIDTELVEQERREMLDKNHNLFDSLINSILKQ